MIETNKKSEQVKERDYIDYKFTFRNIIEDFGQYFLKTDNPHKIEKEK